MHNVSKAYKQAMNKQIRDRGYIQIGLGAISLEAQGTADASNNNYTYWSTLNNLFTNNAGTEEYATYEQNFMKADGAYRFMPTEEEYNFIDVGMATEEIRGAIKIDFGASYPIKGLTVDFGNAYPVEFEIQTDHNNYSFTNNSSRFVTAQNFGDTQYIIIRAMRMVEGQQRLRIKNVLMGVGLSYGNVDVIDSNFNEFISFISAEAPSASFSATIIDSKNEYNVDSQDSFINFLEIGQKVTVSMGTTLEDGQIEWIQLCNLSLKSWGSEKGQFNFEAVDKFEGTNGDYTQGDKIYNRSAYAEVVSILEDMGLTADDYMVDNYLAVISLHNPLSKGSHRECLQTIANACRCIVYQDADGKIVVKPNFALVLEPEDIAIDTEGTEAKYSKPVNILAGSNNVYADYTVDFIKADGLMHIFPENDDYLETGYVSKLIADDKGQFTKNPKINMKFQTGFTFFGLYMGFDGNAPQEMIVRTYLDGVKVSEETHRSLTNETYIEYDFEKFNEIEFEFTKAHPNNRILVNKVTFGDFNDYKLKFADMHNEPYGQREATVKDVSVKVFTYEEKVDSKGEIKYEEVKDDVWVTQDLNTYGEHILVENPLIHTEDMARELAEWLANYYMNNVTYSVDYRGDARLNASDIIHMDSRVVNNLQVAIESNELKFNGAWSGSLVMRKALRKGEE